MTTHQPLCTDLRLQLVRVACGYAHTAVVNAEGRVFVWGYAAAVGLAAQAGLLFVDEPTLVGVWCVVYTAMLAMGGSGWGG